MQDSSKVDLVNQSVTHLLILTSSEHCRAVVDNVSFLPIYQKDEDKDKDKEKENDKDNDKDRAEAGRPDGRKDSVWRRSAAA